MDTDAKRPGSPQPGSADNTFDHQHSSQEPIPMSSYVPRQRTVASSFRPFDLPSSRAHALPPIEPRRLWAIIVLRCCHCGGGHVLRSGDVSLILSGRLVRRCPATKQKYRVGPIKRHHEARRVMRLAVVA